ncbi:MAG: electron transport complex subunit RsxA [Clostridiaceae bacterium]|jgi:electron transport complex protein RnfA|nr:electron transport complex subunit RsxA [Clostridiaceae bacterium]
MLKEILVISISAIFIENFVLVKFLGICPFLGVSKKIETALGMGMAVTFVMAMSSAITWCVDTFILKPFGLDYLQTIAFILVIAALVQLVEMFLQKMLPALYNALGIYLPLITTNCAVLGSALLNIQNNYNFIKSVVFGATAAIGFTVAIVLFAGIREQLEFSDIPEFLKGFPIALITAGLISIAFLGFSGLKL